MEEKENDVVEEQAQDESIQQEEENVQQTSSPKINGNVILANGLMKALKLLPPNVKIVIALVIVGLILFLMIILCGAAYVVLDSTSDDEYNGSPATGSVAMAYAECNSVKVNGVNGVISLEDYVMGVVSAEAYNSEGMEALKAQAIAARTYVIMRTNYCKNAIRNSSADQNYTSNIKDTAREATESTAGLVLTYNGNMFSSQYDSFYKGRDFSCNGTTCSVTYKKEPNHETHVVSAPVSYRNMMAGGHGYGMSQVASYNLAKEGYNYEQILKYFYSDGVQIAKLTSTGQEQVQCGSNGQAIKYAARTTTPTSNDIYYSPPYVGNHNRGQCVWYLKGRANEMIETSSLDSATKQKYVSAITSTRGNGKDWFNHPNLSIFKSSTDIRQPKAGSIIVWKYSDSYARAKGGNWGHVAMIESISSSGKVVVTEGYTLTGSCPNSWGCVTFKSHTFNSLEGLYNWINTYNGSVNGSRYIFLGYVYLFC